MATQRFNGPLLDLYQRAKGASDADIRSAETSEALLSLVVACLRFLSSACQSVELNSSVPDKRYMVYVQNSQPDSLSRPMIVDQFEPNPEAIIRDWQAWRENRPVGNIEMGKMTYTMAMAYFAAVDLFDRGNKKGPATYFECLVGHLFARSFGVVPTKKATIQIGEKKVRLTMDFLFDLGEGQAKIHLPVKTSTRERVVQAWSHQRILDASYGEGYYTGTLVVFSETKLDLKTRTVVEICVPDQWLAYQTKLARMERIYYFDVPQRYADLCTEFPTIQLKNFSEFFLEIEEARRGFRA
jgi:hypothetical protein